MRKEFVFRLVLALGIFFLVYQFGYRPFFTGDIFYKQFSNRENWSKGLSGKHQEGYDVVVLGEDPEGIAAAVSAARLGASTLLVSSGKDLGGIVERCLLADLEVPRAPTQEFLNGGILSEIYRKLGADFSVKQYKNVVEALVAEEKNLLVIYGAALDSPIIQDGNLTGLVLSSGGEKTTCHGRMFIDATRDGTLLEACKIPYFTGSGDLNLPNTYMPLRLHFEMQMVDAAGAAAAKAMAESGQDDFYKKLENFSPADPGIRINSFKIHSIGSGRINIQGIEVANVDVQDRDKLTSAYRMAADEVRKLAVFLATNFEPFKDSRFIRAADSFYIRENRHFSGKYRLSVNDILENRYFDKTIAMGSFPIQAGKLVDGHALVLGKPAQYGIPIGCIVPSSMNNLIMTGAKASYSSLASSSAGVLGTGIATGESAGVIAVYCLLKDTTPPEIEREVEGEKVEEIRKYLRKQRLYIPEKDLPLEYAAHWSYPAVRQLLSLGLIAGGLGNSYNFDKPAVEQDLAILLLNGVFRMDEQKYNLELDSRLRVHFNKEKLTREKAANILLALHGVDLKTGNAYTEACKQGFINDVMQLRLKEKKSLTLDDVYYLGTYNLKLYTGRDIKD